MAEQAAITGLVNHTGHRPQPFLPRLYRVFWGPQGLFYDQPLNRFFRACAHCSAIACAIP